MIQSMNTIPDSLVMGRPMYTSFIDQQPIADEMKRAILADIDMTPGQRKRNLDMISVFEQLPWHPLAFEEALQAEVDRPLAEMKLPLLPTEIIRRTIVRYRHMVAPSPQNFYDVAEAAEYLGLTVAGVKHHVYETKDLVGTVKGKSLIFTEQQLDDFLLLKPAKRGPQKKA